VDLSERLADEKEDTCIKLGSFGIDPLIHAIPEILHQLTPLPFTMGL
jgi:hypothetical protein